MTNRRILTLIVGMLIDLCAGLIYAWSLFVAPLEADLGWNRTETASIFTVSMICFVTGGMLSGFIQKKKSPRFIVMLSAVMLGLGFIWASTTKTLITIYIAYGVCCGLGVGLAYNSVISTVVKWFPERPATVSGIMLMSFGAGGMVLGSIASALMAKLGWRPTFVILGILFAAVFAIGSIWIRTPQPGDILKPANAGKAASADVPARADFSTAMMLKTPSYWAFYMWAFLSSSCGLFIISQASACVLDMGATVTFAAIVTGTISIFNGLARFVMGFVYDKTGYSFSFLILSLFFLGSFVIFIFAMLLKSPWLFLVGAALLPWGYGGGSSCVSGLVSEFYGPKHYPLNFSTTLTHLIPASILGPLAAGAIQTATGSYLPVVLACTGVLIIVFILRFFIRKPKVS